MNSLLRGALAGTAATVPMTAVMLAADRWVGQQPPEAVTRAALDPPESLVVPLTVAVHLGTGAALGSAYALLPRRGPALAVGLALAVWAVSYQGWVPALGALPPASRDRPARPATMVVAHVVFGLALDAVLSRPRGPRHR